MKNIEKFLKNEIGEYFKGHGGGIKVVDFTDGILKIKMLGKCSNCPSAMSEVEVFVSEEVKNKFPSIKDVILVTDISDEMLDFAKKLLKKN